MLNGIIYSYYHPLQSMGMDVYDVKQFLESWVTRSEGNMAVCMDFEKFCEALDHEVHVA